MVCFVFVCIVCLFWFTGRPSRSGTNQKWRSSDESILSNLIQYGLQSKYLDAVVADAAQLVWRGEEMFDAIVTDRELFHACMCVCVCVCVHVCVCVWGYVCVHVYGCNICTMHVYVHVSSAPYGVREGARKVGTSKASVNPIAPEK